MDDQHSAETGFLEHAVLSVLSGNTVEAAARQNSLSPGALAEAVELYCCAGQAALGALPSPTGWHQVYISFADYATAARAFRAYLLPILSSGPIGEWWFLRKSPCWRLRVYAGQDASIEDVTKHVNQALDSMVSWGVATSWKPSLYEPETTAFGGMPGMKISHALFHADSVGVLSYLQHMDEGTDGLLGAKETSLLVMTLLLRAAGLEWGEQGDVWGHVESRRPLPQDVRADQISAMADVLQGFLMLDVEPALADGPLTPLRTWVSGLTQGGQALANAAHEGDLRLGLRRVLARHILFHFNRMGFSTHQQAIWARAAREATLGS